MDHKALARLHGALASETRLEILELISAHREMCACELIDLVGMSQANVSRHLSILRDAGILQDRKLGTWVLLRVDESALEAAHCALRDAIRRNHRKSKAEDAEKRLRERCSTLQPA